MNDESLPRRETDRRKWGTKAERPSLATSRASAREESVQRVGSIVHIDRRGQLLKRAEGHRVGDGLCGGWGNQAEHGSTQALPLYIGPSASLGVLRLSRATPEGSH